MSWVKQVPRGHVFRTHCIEEYSKKIVSPFCVVQECCLARQHVPLSRALPRWCRIISILGEDFTITCTHDPLVTSHNCRKLW